MGRRRSSRAAKRMATTGDLWCDSPMSLDVVRTRDREFTVD
jgi:hypothetical protein